MSQISIALLSRDNVCTKCNQLSPFLVIRRKGIVHLYCSNCYHYCRQIRKNELTGIYHRKMEVDATTSALPFESFDTMFKH